MNKLLILSFLLLLTNPFSAQEKKLKAYLDLKEFYNPSAGAYVEIQLQFSGISTHLKNIGDSALQSTLVIYMDIFQKDSLITSSSYLLNSPQFLLRDSIVEDFYEIKRFALAPGDYSLKLEISDFGDPKRNKINGTESFTIKNVYDKPSLSDITVAEYAVPSAGGGIFQKSGYQIIPMLSNFFPKELTKMPIYFESYNTNQLQSAKVTFKKEFINASNNKVIDGYTSTQSFDTSVVIPHLSLIDIEMLETGSYILNLSMLDNEENELCSTNIPFE